MSTVEITLSQPRNRGKKLVLVIDVLSNSIAQRWLAALREVLELNLFLKKDFCFLGFPDAPEGIDFWFRKLKRYVKAINSYSGKGAWEKGYQIPFAYTAKNIFCNGNYNPEPMWAVHHHFELLMGQRWSLSPYYSDANEWIKYCIIQVNDIVHQIEWLGKSLQQRLHDPDGISPFLMLSYVAPMFPFEESDAKFFKIDEAKFGGVYLKYAQPGKNHWESFLEGDTEIFKSNVNGLRAYTGQFTIDCGRGMRREDLRELKKQFADWLHENNWNAADPALALGRVKVGQLRVTRFRGMSMPEIHRLLAKYANVEKITVRSPEGAFSREYPLHYSDRGYERVQLFRCMADYLRTNSLSASRGVHWTPRRRKKRQLPLALKHDRAASERSGSPRK